MSARSQIVSTRLASVEHRQLHQEAAARNVTVSACIADCLREYFTLRVEMASAVTAPGQPGERHTGLIHSLLARTEERLAATLDAHATALSEDLRRLESMLVRLVQLYLVHTPEVARERHADAVASANRRYANYRQAVMELLATVDMEDTGLGEHREEGREA